MGSPWEVEAEAEVSCDQEVDGGGHAVAATTQTFTTPLEAAKGLVDATAWLLERGATAPLASWRSREDARCRAI